MVGRGGLVLSKAEIAELESLRAVMDARLNAIMRELELDALVEGEACS